MHAMMNTIDGWHEMIRGNRIGMVWRGIEFCGASYLYSLLVLALCITMIMAVVMVGVVGAFLSASCSRHSIVGLRAGWQPNE